MTSGEELGTWRAAWDALRGRPLDHFPRAERSGSTRALSDSEVLGPAAAAFSGLTDDDPGLDRALALAAASLKEVKDQTEYQDVKATRLLTVITFLGAFGAVLFGRYFDNVRPGVLLDAVSARDDFWPLVPPLLAIISYVIFVFFLLCATLGALVTFHATRTRFRYALSAQRKEVRSFLFFKPITETDPDAWGRSFLTEDGRAIAPDLRKRYLQHYVAETALVAAKVADKVRYLAPAQRLLGRAIIALLIWMITALATLVTSGLTDLG